jgi:hypothetical protein
MVLTFVVLQACASTGSPPPEDLETPPPSPESAPEPVPIPAPPPPTDSASAAFAVGDWAGTLDMPSGLAQTVVMTLWTPAEAPAEIGRVLYASPVATCRYSLWLDGVGADSLSLLQRLEDGDCPEQNRVVLRPLSHDRLAGDWFSPGGTHWLTARLDRPPTAYVLTLDGYRARNAELGEKIIFAGLSGGEHTVELHGVPDNCSVMGENPREITTTQGGTLETVFELLCEGDPD